MKKLKIKTSGRINLIGEHVDYIEGISISASINLYTEIEFILDKKNTFKKNFFEKTILRENFLVDKTDSFENGDIIAYSSNFKQKLFINPYNYKIYLLKVDSSDSFGINGDYEIKNDNWGKFIVGVLKLFESIGLGIYFPHSINISGNLPVSAGLSSSASLLIGLISGYNELLALKLSNNEVINYAKIVENRYLNSPCGYLDQYSIVFGKNNSFVFIDFKDLKINYINLKTGIQNRLKENIKSKFKINKIFKKYYKKDKSKNYNNIYNNNYNNNYYFDYVFYIINSKIKHSISNGEYGQRIREKDEIEKIILSETGKSIRSFIDRMILKYDLIRVTDKFSVFNKKIWYLKSILKKEKIYKKFNKILLNRFLHYFSEIVRVYEFKYFIENKRYKDAFLLLNESHFSLSHLYEVSTNEIDYIFNFLNNNFPIFIGTRIIGGGFGGSVLTIVKVINIKDVEILLRTLKEEYFKKYNINIDFYRIKLEDGIIIN